MGQVPPLDARLTAIERMVPSCPCAADIGADHGFLGVHLLARGKCERVQFLDISASSLKKAARLVRRLGLEGRADFAVGDGAQALLYPAQAVVVAGMGGQTIAGIVERGAGRLADSLLVLQPNVAIPELRLRLSRAGFCIVDEDLARAGGRWYVVIAARKGRCEYSPEELCAGPVLIRKRHPGLAGYAQFRIRVTEKALAGAAKAEASAAVPLREELDRWRAIEQWLRR